MQPQSKECREEQIHQPTPADIQPERVAHAQLQGDIGNHPQVTKRLTWNLQGPQCLRDRQKSEPQRLAQRTMTNQPAFKLAYHVRIHSDFIEVAVMQKVILSKTHCAGDNQGKITTEA